MIFIDYLDLPGWKTLEKDIKGAEEIIIAEYTTHPDTCPKCGCMIQPYRYGVKTVAYRDIPNRNGPAVIHARVQRFRCRECLGTFLQPLVGIEVSMRMTVRCADYIRKRCLKDSFTHLAMRIGCSEATVWAISNEHLLK